MGSYRELYPLDPIKWVGNVYVEVPLNVDPELLIYIRDSGIRNSLMMDKIANFKASSSGTKNITIVWSHDSVNNMVGGYYAVLNNSQNESINIDSEDRSLNITGLKAGTGYKIDITAYDNYWYDSYSSKATYYGVTVPDKVAISKLKTGSRYITAYWGKKTGTGYQVMIAKNSKFTSGKKTYTVKSYNTAYKKMTGLKNGQRYYVRVRAYK